MVVLISLCGWRVEKAYREGKGEEKKEKGEGKEKGEEEEEKEESCGGWGM